MKTPEMKHLKYSQWIWLSIFLAGTACEKPSTDKPEPKVEAFEPPQPYTEDTAFVSAAFPGYTLLSNGGYGAAIDANFQRNGTIQWKCLSKPDQAPPPIIEFPNFASSNVGQLQKGEYVFEVTYSTKAGSKQALSHVFVVDDGLANGPVVLPSQAWRKEDWSSFPDVQYWISEIDIENRPDLFCYRKGKKLRVEIQDIAKNEWKEFVSSVRYETSNPPPNPTFFTLLSKNLNLQYDHHVKPDSVMDRIVTQKVAIRLSL